jgi:hypothetical protein
MHIHELYSTTGWAFLYQNIGNAFIFPIWNLFFYHASFNNAYYSSGRAVKSAHARTILPSILVLYTIPTVATFCWKNPDTLQNIIAYWQIAPLAVNIPHWCISLLSSSSAYESKTADLPELKKLYRWIGMTCIAAHVFTVVTILKSDDVSFSSVFLPNLNTWKNSMDDGLLYIFQADWIFTYITIIFSSAVVFYDVQRLLYGITSLKQWLTGSVYFIVATLIGGPGCALLAVWQWREEKLALIEDRLEKGKKSL